MSSNPSGGFFVLVVRILGIDSRGVQQSRCAPGITQIGIHSCYTFPVASEAVQTHVHQHSTAS